jgi:hypothetical protein
VSFCARSDTGIFGDERDSLESNVSESRLEKINSEKA